MTSVQMQAPNWRDEFFRFLRSEFDRLKQEAALETKRDFARHIGVAPGPASDILSGKSKWMVSKFRAKEIIEQVSGRSTQQLRLLKAMGFVPRGSELVAEMLAHPSIRRLREDGQLEDLLEELFSSSELTSGLLALGLGRAKSEGSLRIREFWASLPIEFRAVLFELLTIKRRELAVRYHQEVLIKAKEALARIPIDERDFASIIIAGSSSKISDLTDKINEIFISTWLEDLDECEQGVEVFRICATLFPVDARVLHRKITTVRRAEVPHQAAPANTSIPWEELFIESLRIDFIRAKSGQPNESMRAYSKRLGLSVGGLSLLLSGKANWGLSPERALDLLAKLQIPLELKNRAAVQMGFEPQFERKTIENVKMQNADLFTSHLHLALVAASYLSLENRRRDCLMQRFDLTAEALDRALDDLLAAGLIELSEARELKPQSKFLESTTDITSEAIQCHHRMIIDASTFAARELPAKDCFFQNATLLLSKRSFAKLKAEVGLLLDSASSLTLTEEGPDTLFQIAFQIYPEKSVGTPSSGSL